MRSVARRHRVMTFGLKLCIASRAADSVRSGSGAEPLLRTLGVSGDGATSVRQMAYRVISGLALAVSSLSVHNNEKGEQSNGSYS